MTQRRFKPAVAVVLLCLLANPAIAQDYSFDAARLLSSEQLRARLTWLLEDAQINRNYTYGPYWDDLRGAYDNARQALLERGERAGPFRVPDGAAARAGVAVGAPALPTAGPTGNATGAMTTGRPAGTSTQATPASGARPGISTQANAASPGGTNPSSPRVVAATVLPLLVVLTTAQLAECLNRGLDATKCAAEVAIAASASAAVGTLIAVALPTGAPVLTAVAVGVGAVSTLITSVEAAGEGAGLVNAWLREFNVGRQQSAQQRVNAGRMTPEALERLRAAFQQQVDRSLGRAEAIDDMARRVESMRTRLRDVVEQANRASSRFTAQNAITKNASGLCRQPERNPVLQAVDAENSAQVAVTRAQVVVDAANEARRLVAACESAASARQAKAAWDRARAGVSSVADAVNETQRRQENAERFFAAIAAARTSVVEAGKQVAELESLARDGSLVKDGVENHLDVYRGIRDDATQSWDSTVSAFEALRGAFPDPAPPQVQQMLSQIDPRRHGNPMASAHSDSALAELREQAARDLSRINGLHRLADQQFDALLECQGVPDRMPAELTRLFNRLTAESRQAQQRAEQAIAAAGNLDATIASCLNRWSTNAGSVGRVQTACRGVVDASPEEGRPGTPLRLRIRMEEGNQLVDRVEINNPGCRDDRCRRASKVGVDTWQIWLAFQAPPNATATGGVISRFKVRFNAFTPNNALACTGESAELRVLAR